MNFLNKLLCIAGLWRWPHNFGRDVSASSSATTSCSETFEAYYRILVFTPTSHSLAAQKRYIRLVCILFWNQLKLYAFVRIFMPLKWIKQRKLLVYVSKIYIVVYFVC